MKKKEAKVKFRYEAMPNGVLSKREAEAAAHELFRIEEDHGSIKPQIVVDESEPPSAPLHGHFTWDDSIAANQYRCDQARSIIRSVRIVRDDGVPSSEQEVVRAIVHVKSHEMETRFSGEGYISISRAVSDEIYRQQILITAKSEIASWERRYSDLLSFYGITTEFGAFKAALQSKIERQQA